MIGIYKITNLLTNEIYIGQGVSVEKRFWEHICDAKLNRHPNKQLIQNIIKYGPTNFSFQIIEECNKEQLDERETYWIKYYDSCYNGLNMTLGGKTFSVDFDHGAHLKGKPGHNLGKHWTLSDEAKTNIGSGSSKAWTDERKKDWSLRTTGKPKDFSNTDTSKMGKGTLGKHKVWDDKDKNIYHFE